MSWEEIKLEISAALRQRLEMRHISDDDLKQVIHNAESTGEKLYQIESDKLLAKLRIGKATFYVEYAPGTGAGSYSIVSAYAHKSEIIG